MSRLLTNKEWQLVRQGVVNQLFYGDNLALLKSMPEETYPLVYIDPPFNTGKQQVRKRISVKQDKNGARTGFGGQKYSENVIVSEGFNDNFTDYLGFLEPRLIEIHRILADYGTFYCHIDYREAHYVKVMLDSIFGRRNFVNEIIWAYDYGAKSKKRWPAKHDTILVYAKCIEKMYFDSEAVDREPYMAPGLVTPEKAARGKLPTDVWWHTIVGTNSKEKTGYATQKPLGIMKRIICASCPPGEKVVDVFAGSGTTAEAAALLMRGFLVCDNNPRAIKIIRDRLDPHAKGKYPLMFFAEVGKAPCDSEWPA